MNARFLFAAIVFAVVPATLNAQGLATNLAGKWPNGEWQNSSNSHHGPLHANFTQVSDSQYRVTFGGRFAKVIPFRYTVVLNVIGRSADGTTYLAGNSKLPFFGNFQYDAVATPNAIETRYQSKKYKGKFLLSR